SGEVATVDALSGKTAVALYFSAHWCPPCRGFTPVFGKAYTETYKAKGMEVVFVSSDRDQGSFDEYYGEQPWLALPFAARDIKAALSKKFKVNGIPSLVVLQPDGTLITTEGRGKIGKPEAYPWIPPTFGEVMADATFVDKSGAERDGASFAGKPLGLYFSAHWCPPCRGFTPKLAEYYSAGLKDKLEIVFVSSDQDKGQFDGYLSEMPWPALSFAQRDKKEVLSDMFKVEGIPTFVILDADGKIITTDGRSAVEKDKTGANFPEMWLPQPLNDVNDDPGPLNEETCFLIYGPDEDSTKAIEAVAREYYDAAGKDVDSMKYRFFTAPDGGIMSQIRKLTGTPDARVRLAILDLPAGGKYHVCDEATISPDFIKATIAEYEAGKIAMSQIRR
ncbi:thioredoxin-like domain-containing protein, partial [bacterium]|nr:thioredoxin-like domain-containing protein [bacterium]